MMKKMFGFLTDNDLQPLRDRITDLEIELKLQKAENKGLLARLESLEIYCYNVSGFVSEFKKFRDEQIEKERNLANTTAFTISTGDTTNTA